MAAKRELTLLEKINTITWFDHIENLRDILRRLRASISGNIKFIQQGTNVTITGSGLTEEDPLIINSTGGGGGGGVQSIVAGTNVSVNATDPVNPIVSASGIEDAPSDGKAYVRINGAWQLASLQRVAEASVNSPEEIAKSNIQIAVESDTALPGNTVTSTLGYEGVSYVNVRYDDPSEGDYSFKTSNLGGNVVAASSLVSLSGIESYHVTQIYSPSSVDKRIIESIFDSNTKNIFILDDVSNVGAGFKTIKFPQVAVGDTEVLAIEP